MRDQCHKNSIVILHSSGMHETRVTFTVVVVAATAVAVVTAVVVVFAAARSLLRHLE